MTRIHAAAAGAMLAALTLGPLADPDIGWMLDTGQRALAGELPRYADWSWTSPTAPVIAHAWGAAAAMSLLTRVAGPVVGLHLWQLTTLGAALALLTADARRRLLRWDLTIAVVLPVAVAMSHFATPRGVLASYAFITAESLWWRSARVGQPRRSRAVTLVALQALWVNTHGMAILGPTLPLLFAGAHRASRREALRRSAWRALGQLATPYGLPGALHAARVVSNSTPMISEYASPDFHSPSLLLAAVMLLVAISHHARRHDHPGAAVLATLTLAGLVSVKYLPVAILFAAPTLVDLVQALAPRRGIRPGWVAASLAAAATITTVLAVRGGFVSDGYYPVGPARWLAAHPQPCRPVWAPMTAGGYLLHQATSNERIAWDGRNDTYPVAVQQAMITVVRGDQGWRDILNPDSGLTVIARRDGSIDDRLDALPHDWSLRYRDARWVLYEPVRPATRPLPQWDATGTRIPRPATYPARCDYDARRTLTALDAESPDAPLTSRDSSPTVAARKHFTSANRPPFERRHAGTVRHAGRCDEATGGRRGDGNQRERSTRKCTGVKRYPGAA